MKETIDNHLWIICKKKKKKKKTKKNYHRAAVDKRDAMAYLLSYYIIMT